jgi:tellurite resistance protein
MSVELASAIAELVPTDHDRFLAALELAYLAASADGLDETERTALASVLERATASRIDRDTFTAHFMDLDAAVHMLGRRERLARTAADFPTDDSRTDAIRFATLIAMADGTLHDAERGVLHEAGEHFAWPAAKVDGVIDEAVRRVGGAR